MHRAKGFFTSQIDASFRSLVAARMIRAIYAFYVLAILALALQSKITAFGSVYGVAMLVLVAPLVLLLYLMLIGVFLKAIIAAFRVTDSTQELLDVGRPVTPAADCPSAPRR